MYFSRKRIKEELKRCDYEQKEVTLSVGEWKAILNQLLESAQHSEVVNFLHKAKKQGYKYIAQDEDGTISFFTNTYTYIVEEKEEQELIKQYFYETYKGRLDYVAEPVAIEEIITYFEERE